MKAIESQIKIFEYMAREYPEMSLKGCWNCICKHCLYWWSKRCGNAVCPPVPAALIRANLPEMCVAERTGNIKIMEGEYGQMKFA